MRTLADIFPDIDLLASAEPHEIGYAILELWDEAERSRNKIRTPDQFFEPPLEPTQNPNYGDREADRVITLIAEGWQWLVNEGLIVRRPDQSTNRYSRTRRGEKLKTEADVEAYKQAAALPRELLHPIINEKAWPLFMRGDYDVAVFQAFKSIEVAVRKVCDYPDNLIGPPLMRKAFDPKDGPLHDPDIVSAERQAMSDLFAGAIGHAKNPLSHRDKPVSLEESAHLLMFATYLMSIVDWHKAVVGYLNRTAG